MSSGFKKTFELVFECDIYVVVNKAKSFMSLSIINILKYSKSLKKHITLQIILTSFCTLENCMLLTLLYPVVHKCGWLLLTISWTKTTTDVSCPLLSKYINKTLNSSLRKQDWITENIR